MTIWDNEITAWQTSLRAIGRATGTVWQRGVNLAWLAKWAGDRTPGELTTGDLLEFMGENDWAPETRRGVRASLRGFYGWRAVTFQAENPAMAIPAVKLPRPKPRPAPEMAYRQALAKAKPWERLALRLAATCGLRRAEVAEGHSRFIFEDLGDGYTLQVNGKGGVTRFVPLPDNLAMELLALEPGYFFPGKRDGHLSPEHVGKAISRLLPEGVTMHMLRHRFATLAYQIDKDLFAVQDLLGHQSPVTTRNYVLTDTKAGRRLVDLVAAA